MTIYISRDYSSASISSKNYFTPFYQIPIFLHRVLGYSVVGSTAFDITTPITTLSIENVTNTTPIEVTTSVPHGLTSQTCVTISNVEGTTSANGSWMIIPTGSKTFTLTTSSGNGAYISGGSVTFGFLIASGSVADSTGTGINFGSTFEKEIAIPIGLKKVASADIGRMIVLKSTKFPTKNSGCFKISNINVGNNTTIAAGSNGQVLPQTTINVTSTTGFPSSGTIFVASSTGQNIITYTGTTSTTFTGCSGGTGTLSTGGTVANLNRYVLDYRSTENPPAESVNSIDWWLYEAELAASAQSITFSVNSSITIAGATNTSPIEITTGTNHGYANGQTVRIQSVAGNTAANGIWTITTTGLTTFTLNGSTGNGNYTAGGSAQIAGYPGDGVSQNSRIILQSPHSSAWQVRFCLEPGSSNMPAYSITTGYNGNSSGDFLPNNPHAHVHQFFDINAAQTTGFNNLVPGGGSTSNPDRITIVADDDGQNVFAYTRNSGANGMFSFGIPNNEPAPLATKEERVYCYGSGSTSNYGGINLRIGTTTNTSFAFRNGMPRFAALSGWGNLDGTSGTSPIFSSNAGDSPFISATEVLPIEIWNGINTDMALSGGTTPPFFYDQYFMGTAPFLRNGRANFGNFTLSTEEVTSRTVNNATNTSPIKITTSATNALTTGQTVTISGVVGNTAANGTWTITVIDSTNFTLDGSVGNGTYSSGGTVNGCAKWLHLQNGIYVTWNGASGLTA